MPYSSLSATQHVDPLVSVVVTTRNSGRHIERCLRSVREQTYPNIELIVVDNHSEDNTLAAAERLSDQTLTHGPERSAQRNFGLREVAKGRYAIYLDSDNILAPTTIEGAVRFLEQPGEVGTVGLKIHEITLGRGYWAEVRRFEISFYSDTVISALRFMRRDAFMACPGFDETLNGAEDWDLDRQMERHGGIKSLPFSFATGQRPLQESPWTRELSAWLHERGVDGTMERRVLFHDETEISVDLLLKKKTYYSSAFPNYIAKYGRNNPVIRKQLGAWYRMIGIFLEKGQWWKLARHPLLTVGMLYLRLRVGLIYLAARLGKADANAGTSPYDTNP